ncbi:hypothetical protein G9A89_012758 [Geosiphon pyriformis]|nr:hypothetical protein G9A89_012758 [Geosiphon pyriformis]
MAIKAKNSKKQQQTVTTAMITPNLFVVSDEIFVSGAANNSAWENVNGYQRFSGWMASNLVSGAIFKIKMALLSSLFQLLSGCIGLKSVLQDTVKLFCVEFAFQKSLNSATKVAISNKSSDMNSVSSLSLSVALRNISLNTSSDDIKTALNIFGVVTSVKLKPAGLWQYAVTAVIVVLSGVAAANMDLDFGSPPKTVTSMLPAVLSAPNFAVKSKLTSLKSHLSKLSVLIKSLVEPVSALIALVTKLLSTPSAMDVSVKEYVDGLAKQNKGLAATCLEDGSDVDDMVDNVNDDNNNDKDFSVYNNIFDVIMHLWEDQPSRIKSSPN